LIDKTFFQTLVPSVETKISAIYVAS